MASKDQKSDFNVEPSILPQTASGNVNGSEVDTLGYEGVTLEATMDATAVGTFKLQESDTSGSGYTDVASDNVIGTNDVAGVQSDVVTIGYIGDKRFVRAVFTHATTGVVCANVRLGCPNNAPTGANS